MSIEFEPQETSSSLTFSPAPDLNTCLDYQLLVIDKCVQWMSENPNTYDAFSEHLVKCIVRSFKQIQHLQKQIQLETAIDEEDTE
jgi:hypothetical protein